ncbi:MAG: MscS Mechanosensitive ion channel [Chthoniobacter sp.]|nr:MscS Mechanosensitive ion channel [Chthoniobacter sp.]
MNGGSRGSYTGGLVIAVTLPALDPLTAALIAAPILLIAMVALGRVLKRRYGVRLGFFYGALCVVIAVYVPLAVSPLSSSWREAALRHLGAATVLLGTFFVLALARRFFWENWFERIQKTRAPKFLSQIIALIVFLGALLVVFGVIYGYSIQGAVLGSTVVLGIIGFAMQDLLGNIIAGIALELGKPFRSGDWLMVEKHRAEVIEVNWRSTRLRTNDDVYLDIPNKAIVGATITNLTFPTRQHAIRLTVKFEHSVPPNMIKDLLIRAAAEVKGVLRTPPPKAFMGEFIDSVVTYEIKAWIDDEAIFNDIVDGIRTNVWYAAHRANLQIPFPTRRLKIERPVADKGASLALAQETGRKHPLLQLLNEEEMQKLLTRARLQRFGRGEKIITQGAGGDSMFILLRGEAEVFVTANCQDTQVATLEAGEYCGEMSLLTGEPRSATVIARTDCEAWEIEKSAIAEVLQENESLVRKLGEVLAQRRLATEGILASASKSQVLTKQQEYTDGFLHKLSAFFDL